MDRQVSPAVCSSIGERSDGACPSDKETPSVADEAFNEDFAPKFSEAMHASRPGKTKAEQVPVSCRRASACSASRISRLELIKSIVEESTTRDIRLSSASERRSSKQRRHSANSISSSGSDVSGRAVKATQSSSTNSSQVWEDEDLDIEVMEASKRMATVQKYMQLWQVQLIFVCASLLHCAFYLVGEQVEVCGWLEATGAVVIGLTLLELLVRVAAQAGWPWFPSAWKRFLLPIFHIAEIFVVAALIARCGWVMHTCPISIANDRADVGFDRPSLAVVLYHRAMRAWAIFYGVSLQSTLKHRHYQDCKKPDWWQDWKEERRKETKRLRFRLAGFLGDLRAQFGILLLVVAHCAFYTVCRVTSDRFAWSVAEPIGYLTFGVLAFEFSVRCLAQGGEQFFSPALHKVEVAFLGAASFVLLYPALYSNWIAVGRGGWQPDSWKVCAILLIHRTIRFLATHHDVSASEFGIHSVLEAKAFTVFLSMFGDLLEVSPQNVHISLPSPTQKDIKVRIIKAKLKTEAFRGLHVPIAVRGGLVEALDVILPRPLRGERHEDLVTRFVLKNLLLLAGPGGGLGEAGFGTTSRYWVSDNVVEHKSKLVELICQKLSVLGYAHSNDADEKREGSRREGSAAFGPTFGPTSSSAQRKGVKLQGAPSWSERARMQFEMRLREKLDSMKEKVTNFAQDLALNHVEVSIQNVRVEYEDLDEGLGYNHAMIGLRVGDVFISRLLEQRLTITASRLGVSVDVSRNIPKNGEANKGSRGIQSPPPLKYGNSTSHIFERKHTARGLCRIIGEHPQKVMDQMHMLNLGEKLRLCAFEALDPEPLEAVDEPLSQSAKPLSDWQRHRRCERWPERYLVISLLRVSLQAGPADGNGNWCRLSDSADIRDRKRSARMSLWSTRGQKSRKRKQRPWMYRAHLSPLRIAIDDEQARYLQTLLSCLQSWSLHDEAFRWRPDFMPLSPALCTDGLRQERSAIVRLWWMYALHRVLARLNKRPHVPTGLQVSWRLANVSRYRELIMEVAHRPGAEVSQLASDSWTWSDWEKAWAKELQMRLRFEDILECRRSGLASLRCDHEERTDQTLGMGNVGERLAEMKNKFAQMNMEQIAEVQQRVMEVAENWQDRMEGAVEAVENGMEAVEERVRHQVLDVLEVLDATAKTGRMSHLAQRYSRYSSVFSRGRSFLVNGAAPRLSTARDSEYPMNHMSTMERQPTSDDIEAICGEFDMMEEEEEEQEGEHEGEEAESSSESNLDAALEQAAVAASTSISAKPARVTNTLTNSVRVTKTLTQDAAGASTAATSSAAPCQLTRAGTVSSTFSRVSAWAMGRAESSKSATASTASSDTMFGNIGTSYGTGRQEEAVETESGRALFDIQNAAGSWQVTMSGFEVRILRHTPEALNARAVLLHMKLWDITLDACILPAKCPKPADPEALAEMLALSPYTATISVSSVGVTCPDAHELLLRSGREVLRVTKPVVLPPPKPKQLAGSRTGTHLAFAVRVGVTSDPEPFKKSEIYCSDLCVVASSPLLDALLSFASPEDLKEKRRQSIIVDAEEERWQPPTSKERFGKADVKTQQRFELLTGVRGIFLNWCAEVNFGSCQFLQVSQYAEAKMLVEEYRLWPLSTSACQGEREKEEDKRDSLGMQMTRVLSSRSRLSMLSNVKDRKNRWITMESKGFKNIDLLPWSDPNWLIEDELDKRTYLISYKGKLSGLASDKENNAPYLQVHLKGGVSSLSGGPTSPLCCFNSYNDWRAVHPCFTNMDNQTSDLASDDVHMPLRFCGATASCSCMISARAPVFASGHSPQSPEAPQSRATAASNFTESSETSSTVADIPELLPRMEHMHNTLTCSPEKCSGWSKPWCAANSKSKEAEMISGEAPNRSSEWTSCAPNSEGSASMNALRSIPCEAAYAPVAFSRLDETQRTGVELRIHIVPCDRFGRGWLEHLATRWYEEVYPPQSALAVPRLKRSCEMHFSSSRPSQHAPAVLRPSRRKSHNDLVAMPLPMPDSHDIEMDENN